MRSVYKAVLDRDMPKDSIASSERAFAPNVPKNMVCTKLDSKPDGAFRRERRRCMMIMGRFLWSTGTRRIIRIEIWEFLFLCLFGSENTTSPQLVFENGIDEIVYQNRSMIKIISACPGAPKPSVSPSPVVGAQGAQVPQRRIIVECVSVSLTAAKSISMGLFLEWGYSYFEVVIGSVAPSVTDFKGRSRFLDHLNTNRTDEDNPNKYILDDRHGLAMELDAKEDVADIEGQQCGLRRRVRFWCYYIKRWKPFPPTQCISFLVWRFPCDSCRMEAL
ncbi:hypothetical protein ARMSODRAFT_1009642 [Armillaria solidipes]|uniref:Uncharacterized protein n=1 Tax=Armillaria solidipes TaxID=1076256 RepID=A0A2H3B505_9AGAR|nr:hypothetical protein ARMSODRAFT_1009642 [Armillaria solidipes]